MAEPRPPVAGVFPGDIPCRRDRLTMEQLAPGTDMMAGEAPGRDAPISIWSRRSRNEPIVSGEHEPYKPLISGEVFCPMRSSESRLPKGGRRREPLGNRRANPLSHESHVQPLHLSRVSFSGLRRISAALKPMGLVSVYRLTLPRGDLVRVFRWKVVLRGFL